MFKKSFAILLIFLLVFSSSAFGATLPLKEKTEKPKRSSYQINKEEFDQQYKPKDKVRIVVELKEKPAIDYAQEKGIKFSDLPTPTKEKLQKDILTSQDKVKSQIKSKQIKIEYINQFTNVVNGFSAKVEYGNLPLIEQLENVADVHIVNEYERPSEKPEMKYSKELVQAQEAWRVYKFKGEGMVVGVIDTGMDPSHRDMILTDNDTAKLKKSDVENRIGTNGLQGKYYTDKVPYGYNYMDHNHTIQDKGAEASMHGMHVSGTVAANGDEENNGIQGIAPEAQILALKVFGNDPEFPSTFGDIYVKAIDDAIALGADVLNMSLGSTAGFVSPEDPEQKAIQKAVDNGILMAISAGNSAHFGNGFANPYAENPDIGVSGSPGLSYHSLQVASSENKFMDLDAVSYKIGEETGKAPFLSASSVHPNNVETKTFELAYGGLGKPEELANVDGKYALIVRGELAFTEKVLNAQAAGALGVIIYNNADGYVNMQSDPAIKIPQLFMLKANGDKLAKALKENQKVTITFEGDKTTAPNPEAGKMSDFTSWGLTPNLDFKPEITAPGGQIYSTLENNEYGMMSGTSMAAPHVAGGSALVLQRVDKEFKLSGLERVKMAKNLMMNTAQPITDQGILNSSFGWETPYSPRRQGAGIMQLHSALSSPVIVTEKTTNEGKVALKEVGEKIEFTLKVKNYSNTDVKYDVHGNLQTDFAGWGEFGYNPDELEAQPILDAEITINGENTKQITVPAKDTVEFKVQVDLSNAKVDDPSVSGKWGIPVDINEVFPNGYFVEGFVTLTDPEDKNPELSVPYVGFKGDWNAAPIVDAYADSGDSFYDYTGLIDENGYYLGQNPLIKGIKPDKNAISPNGDGTQDSTIPVLSFLRNAKKVEFNILDKEGNHLRTIRTENEIRKNYYDRGLAPMYSLNPARGWDGKINNEVIEGDYYYEVKATLDYPGTEPQSFTMPVKVDITSPTLDASYADGVVTLAAADNENGSGVAYVELRLGGKSVALLSGDETEHELGLGSGQTLTVVAVDYAGNEVKETILNKDEEETDVPDIRVLTPEAFSTLGEKEVAVSGYVADDSGIESLTIGGKEVDVAYNEETDRYEFHTTLEFETDGVHRFDIAGVDGNGTEISFSRTVFVDTTVPTLNVTGAPSSVGKGDPNPKVSVEVKDNFDEIRLKVNGSEVFYNEFKEPFDMRAFEKTIKDIELKLKDGVNKFVFEVTDLAGHKATQEIQITKLTESPGGGGGGIPVPVQPTLPSDQGDYKVDDKEATLVVDGNKLESAIKDSTKGEVVVDLSAASNKNIPSILTALQSDTIKKIADNNKSLVLQTGKAAVTIPASVLADLAKAATGNVEISIKQEEPKAGTNFVSKVYDFNISYQNNGKATAFDQFKEPVTVEMAITGSTIKDKRKTAAYYFDEKENKWVYSGGKVVGDKVQFKTSHFSKYVALEHSISFKDVEKHWAKDEIEVLASRLITSGKTADIYAPADKLTRAEFAVLLVRALNIPTKSYEGVFSDVTEKQGWSVLQIEAASRAGIVNGDPSGKYNPQDKITREQMATMIIRAIQYKDKSLLKDLKPNKKFSDQAQISSYAKEAVQQAAELGIIKGKTSTTFAPKDPTNRGEAAVMLYRLLGSLDEY